MGTVIASDDPASGPVTGAPTGVTGSRGFGFGCGCGRLRGW